MKIRANYQDSNESWHHSQEREGKNLVKLHRRASAIWNNDAAGEADLSVLYVPNWHMNEGNHLFCKIL